MRAEERRSIFNYFQAYLAEIVGISNGTSGNWVVPSEANLPGPYLLGEVGFLATLDAPIEPFMLRWRECFRPGARAHYSLLLAELVMEEWSTRRVFTNPWLYYYDRTKCLAALPENEEFLVEQLRPVRVVEYLARAADDFEVLKPRERQQIELAFDWMAALA
jgi:hypothetical protein